MKIIGVGFGRTGTLSTQTALKYLGFKCYHMFEVYRNPTNKHHLDFWYKVAHSEPGAQHKWHEVFENYDVTIDYPGCCVWRELRETYPDAKVLLTLHPKGPESWYRSTVNTIYKPMKLWQFRVLEFIIPKVRKLNQINRKLIWSRFLKMTMEDKDQAIARYQDHIEEIRDHVPENQLLVFSVDQGWDPLCRFLGKEVPHVAFPNVNDSQAFQSWISNACLWCYVFLGILVLGFAALLYLLISLFT